MLNLINPENIPEGIAYSLINFLIFIGIFYYLLPSSISKTSLRKLEKIYITFFQVLFLMALCSLVTDIFLGLVFGAAETSFTSTRPPWATFLGYVSGAAKPAFWMLFLTSIILYGTFNKRLLLLIALFILFGIVIGQRSTAYTLLSMSMMAFCFSPHKIPLSASNIAVALAIVLFSALLGQIVRTSGTEQLFSVLAIRFFQEISVLYLALTDYEAINNILLQDQPQAMLSQMFSFLTGREFLPSSVTLPQFWGFDFYNRGGHFVGYIYGWLGLSYGLGAFIGGTIINSSFFIIVISNIRRLIVNSSSFSAFMFLPWWFFLFLEYFNNLGLDSFVEKGFKLFIYICLIYSFLALINRSYTTIK